MTGSHPAVHPTEVNDLPLKPDEELRGDVLRRALALATTAWLFGAVWITATSGAPITLFAKSMDASRFQFGVLSALPFFASLISMPASLLTDRTGERKKIFLWALYLQRLMWFPIALIPLWMIGHNPESKSSAMLVFLALIFIMHAGQAAGGPAWTSWMADIVPDRARGTYFSRRRQWGFASAIPTALLVGWLLDHHSFVSGSDSSYHTMKWCAIIFMCAAVFGIVDIHLFKYVPEVPMKPRPQVPMLKMLTTPLRDKQFMWFNGFVATLVFAVSFMGQFVTLYLIEKLRITNTSIQLMLLVIPMAGQMAVMHVWGKAVDRMGKKPVLILASLGLVPVGLGWCFMHDGLIWLGYILSVAGAMLWMGVETANLNLVLEFCGTQDQKNGESGGSNYVAVNSVVVNIAGCLGGLSSGVIAELMRSWEWQIPGFKTISYYEVLFAISGVLRLAAVIIFLPHIHEHDAKPAAEALRFMSANIYNNLFNAIQQPVRLLGLRRKESCDEA